jgi:hypothetical protein
VVSARLTRLLRVSEVIRLGTSDIGYYAVTKGRSLHAAREPLVGARGGSPAAGEALIRLTNPAAFAFRVQL